MDNSPDQGYYACIRSAHAARRIKIVIANYFFKSTSALLASLAALQGVHIVDAQMTGGRAGAEKAQLRYMLGGDDAILERCRPVFATSAAEQTNCGEVGMGAVAKLCNNLVQYVAWQGYVEAAGMAEQAGLERDKFNEILSWLFNDNARAMLAGRTALQADPDNEFLKGRFTEVMLLAEKDMTLALSLARSVGVTMPTAGLCTQQLARLFGVPDAKRR